MASYRNILLCYDGTLEGRKALRQGAELAVELQASTHLLSVGDLSAYVSASVDLAGVCNAQCEENAHAILKEGIDWLVAHGVETTGHCVMGTPIKEITRFVNELGIDLVVLGYRPRRGFVRWWRGRGNVSLLDLVSCSVLVTCAVDETSEPLALPKAGVPTSPKDDGGG